MFPPSGALEPISRGNARGVCCLFVGQSIFLFVVQITAKTRRCIAGHFLRNPQHRRSIQGPTKALTRHAGSHTGRLWGHSVVSSIPVKDWALAASYDKAVHRGSVTVMGLPINTLNVRHPPSWGWGRKGGGY